MQQNYKISIIGFSRFGKLWAEMMRPFGHVQVFDITDEEKSAKKIGVTFFDFKNKENFKQLTKSDFIFFAVSIKYTEEVILKTAPYIDKKTVCMDVCSVKTLPCKWLTKYLKDHEILGTHPMFGPDSAKTGLRGKQIVTCPMTISPKNQNKVYEIFNYHKLKIIETSPKEHDKQSAYSLAMVHFLGRALDKIKLLDKIEISSLGFERLMSIRETVSNDSLDLFKNMQEFNPYAKEMRKKLLKNLIEIDKKLKKL
jgi:prephenate dehydrogenase